MKRNDLTVFFVLFFFSVLLGAQQNGSNKESTIFTSQERDSLQLCFYDRATVMGVEGEKRDEFYNIVLYHTFKIKNLGKKEKGLTDDEIKVKFEALLKKQNQEVRQLLSDKQYNYYLETFGKILDSVYSRKGW